MCALCLQLHGIHCLLTLVSSLNLSCRQVCAHCLLMGAHIEHPRVSLHTAVMDRRAKFTSAVEALTAKHASVVDFTARAEAAIENLSTSCRTIRQQVSLRG